MCAGRYKKTADTRAFFTCHIWPIKPLHLPSQMNWRVRSQEKERNEEKKKKKISFSFKRIPPSEILFRCTLHFVALMQALNCFGTCHKNWWNSFSLQSTFSFILLSLLQCPVFPAFYLLSLFLPELLSIVSRKHYQLVFEQSTYLNFLQFVCIDTLKMPKEEKKLCIIIIVIF